jgi:hypothetical protein
MKTTESETERFEREKWNRKPFGKGGFLTIRHLIGNSILEIGK